LRRQAPQDDSVAAAMGNNSCMTIVLGVILSLIAVISAVVVFWFAIWAAKKDGEKDRAVQERTGIRRKTRIGL
jgi:hypothetical protein